MSAYRNLLRFWLLSTGTLGCFLSYVPQAHAQTVLRRPVNAGEVTGLELSLEGGLRAPRGGHFHWLATVHEVVGLSNLRPAPGVRLRLLSSLVRDHAVSEVTADSLGRVQLTMDVPNDAPATFHVVFEAVSSRSIRRQFDLDVSVDPAHTTQLEVDRTSLPLGADVQTWGRVVSTVNRGTIANLPVVLELTDQDGRLVTGRVETTTNESGAFSHRFHLPDDHLGRYTITARSGADREFASSAQASVETALLSTPAVIARVAPQQRLTRPGETITVDVVARTGDGRPIRGAVVSSPMLPTIPQGEACGHLEACCRALGGNPTFQSAQASCEQVAQTAASIPNGDTTCRSMLNQIASLSQAPSACLGANFIRTDARGRAQFRFVAPNVSAAFQDLQIPVSVTRTGLGTANANTSVRIVRTPLVASLSVEGGALIPTLSSRVYVRVVRADGSVAPAGVNVTLAGPRLPANLRATTDASGAAFFDVVLRPANTPAPRPAPRPDGETEDQETVVEDSCGGGTSTSFAIEVGQGAESGSLSGCMTIDPDATVRIRNAVAPGILATTSPEATLRLSLLRAPSVARLPIEVALVAVHEGRLAPLVARLVPANTNDVSITVPADAVGQLIIRARPLFGSTAIAVRGGVTGVWSAPSTRMLVTAERGTDNSSTTLTLDHGAAPLADHTLATVVILPRDEGEVLWERIHTRNAVGIGDLRVPFARASDVLIAGAIAATVHADDAAPAVLRDGRLTTIPAPEEPASRGTLRDPWRASARFVEGRLALVFRQIEEHVSAQLSGGRDNVAVRGADGRWNFNAEIFDAIAASGSETGTGARSLGGAPLSIETLRRLDPSFTYDNLARRITRRRMFAVLLGLRRFVTAHSLDLRWSWRGDPSSWLRSLTNGETDDSGEVLSENQLIDGWGNLIALRPSAGQPRFPFLSPVPGFELVSAGPDGRFGTGDDMADPFVRVLPSGGAYARAVDEDGLMARLHGVELGRATISRLASVFGVEASYDGGSAETASEGSSVDWNQIPSRITEDPHALDLVRPSLWSPTVAHTFVSLTNDQTIVPSPVDDEPRTYAIVVDAWDPSGATADTIRRFTAGTPVLIDWPLLATPEEIRPIVPRLRVDEAIRFAATITNLADEARSVQVLVRAQGPVTVSGGGTIQIPQGESAETELVLRANAPGPASIVLTVQDSSGRVLREVTARVIADNGALPLRDDIAAVVSSTEPRELQIEVPSGHSIANTRLVVRSPSTIADDPELDNVRRVDPALIAWAYALTSRPLPESLAAALYQAQTPGGPIRYLPSFYEPYDRGGGQVVGTSPLLSTSCALVAWSSANEDDQRAAVARQRATQALMSIGYALDDTDGNAGHLRESAAVLAALATGAAGATESEVASGDPVAVFSARLRAELREALRTHRTQPTLLARAAAALLLTDAADNRGIALFDAARRAVTQEGTRWFVRGGEGRRGREEETTATIALAIAAQQRGELELARRLGTSAMTRSHILMRTGGESTFWLLAAASYGVFGLSSPTEVTITQEGNTQRIALQNGMATHVLSNRNNTRITVSVPHSTDNDQASAFVRLEVLHEQQYATRNDSGLTLRLEGDPGYAEEVSALELSVRNTRRTVASHPVLEIQLPAGARFDEAARAALTNRGRITQVELRHGALLRIVLDRLSPDETLELPLAVRWLARGRVTGFAATAYLADQPQFQSVLVPRSIDLRPRPLEQ